MKVISGTNAVQAEKNGNKKEKPHGRGYWVAASKRGGLGFKYGLKASNRKSISAISSAVSASSVKMGLSGMPRPGPYWRRLANHLLALPAWWIFVICAR